MPGTIPADLLDPATGVLLRSFGSDGTDARVGFALSGTDPVHRVSDRCAGDPVLFAQYVRQTGLALVHLGEGVPFTHQVAPAWLRFDATVAPGGPAGDAAGEPVTAVTTRVEVERRRGQVTGIGYDLVLLRGGRTIGTGGARLNVLSPAVLRFVRGRNPAPDTGPAPGTGSAPDAGSDPCRVVPTGPASWDVELDPGTLLVSGHRADHVPGTVLVAVAGRLAAPGGTGIRSMDAEFYAYTGVGRTVTAVVERSDVGATVVLGHGSTETCRVSVLLDA
ncbi:hypothetical protein [Pseudonocardia sp. HH130630-07]|uniref:hypothetical protein n=1 Tax=Pseudonocardia sp. HH130630-07 TaxID=1690815 RepID=UPI0008153D09|nr:hypothetical protein [Pseudonocardia sp. HH130630-07]ANY07826.1 hypothetical protein AFB00_17695 [Pseudonocardia sp. HH130630-07]